MMDEVFFWVRVFNFSWSFLLFIGLLYWGITDLLLSHRCGHEHIPPEMRLWALASFVGTIVIMGSIAEVIFTDTMGGYRVFGLWPYLALVTVALKYGAVRVKMHRTSVEKGHCA